MNFECFKENYKFLQHTCYKRCLEIEAYAWIISNFLLTLTLPVKVERLIKT